MPSEADVKNENSKYDIVSPYGYTPDAWLGVLFIVCFGLSTFIHFIQLIRYRLWVLLPTICACGILEIIGWAGRLWSSYNVLLNTPYLIQIICTIIAPTPLVAASFVVMGQCVRRLGQQYSRLSARWYSIIFCSCDVISLVVQALGGAEATSSVAQNAKTGSNIMLAGIIFQTIAITIYVLFASEFMFRYIYDRPIRGRVSSPTPYGLDKNMKTMLFALAFSSLCIYLRSWYRMIELADGWNGYIIHTQRYFVIMDALMVTLAMFIMNICHPGRLLGPAKEWKNIVPSNPLDKMEASRVSAESWSQVADDKGMLTNTSAPTS